MLDDPGLDSGAIVAGLAAAYGLRGTAVRFLPVGHDPSAAAYQVDVGDGASYFLKVRFAPLYEPGLLVPRALLDVGVHNVIAPLWTRTGDLWAPLPDYDGYTVVLYPFVRGENAKLVGLTDEQWRVFGATLQAVHSSGLEASFRGRLRTEDFALPSAALVRRLLDRVASTAFETAAAAQLADFYRENTARIRGVLDRTEGLGRELQARPFVPVLCHSDIHGANILVGEDDRIWLVDWDGPLLAPRERDLLFVVGSRIGRAVTPREEDRFFDGYGPTAIDPTTLSYYRYERIVEDLGEFGKSVFLNPSLSETARTVEAELAMAFFALDGDIDHAEVVPRSRWPAPAP